MYALKLNQPIKSIDNKRKHWSANELPPIVTNMVWLYIMIFHNNKDFYVTFMFNAISFCYDITFYILFYCNFYVFEVFVKIMIFDNFHISKFSGHCVHPREAYYSIKWPYSICQKLMLQNLSVGHHQKSLNFFLWP